MFKKNLKEIYLRTGHVIKFKCGEFGIIDRNVERILLSNGNYEALCIYDPFTLHAPEALMGNDYEIEQVFIGTVYTDNPADDVENLTLVWDRTTYEKTILFEAIMDGSFREILGDIEKDDCMYKSETEHEGETCIEWGSMDGTIYRFCPDVEQEEDDYEDYEDLDDIGKWSHVGLTNQDLMSIKITHTGYVR